MNSKIWKISAPLLIGIAIFIAVFHMIGIGKILQNLQGLNVFLYSLAICFILCSILLWTLRWRLFIEAYGGKASTFNLSKNLIVGLAINNITPFAKLGGEPVRAYLLKKRNNIKMRKGLASILAELTIFFTVTLGFITISLFLIPLVTSPPRWIGLAVIPFAITAALMLAGIIGIYSERDIVVKIIEWFGNKVERLKPYKDKLIKRYSEFQETFRICLRDKKAFSKALAATILARGLNLGKFFLIFTALGYQISLLTLFIGLGISFLVHSLPTTPGSLGVFETGFISIFVFLGTPPQIAATAVFLDRLVWFWGITAIGGSLGTYYGINIWKTGYT